MYEPALKRIGEVTGIRFLPEDLTEPVRALKAKDVRASIHRDNATFGRYSDPDGNVFFLAAPDKVKVHRAGLSSLAFVTVASRDSKKTGEFFTKALGMRQRRDPGEEGEPDFFSYRLSTKGTGVMPLSPPY